MDFIYTLVTFEFIFLAAVLGLVSVIMTFLVTNRTRRYRQLPCIAGFLFIFAVAILGRSLLAVPKILTTTPSANGQLTAEAPLLTISFTAPVDFRLVKIHTFPEMDLTVTPQGYLSQMIPFGRSLTVKANTTIASGERIKVYVANIKGPVTWGYGGEKLLEFTTVDPQIIAIHPPEATREMQPLQSFTIKLSHPSGKENEWSIRSHPTALLSVHQVDSTTLQVHTRIPLQQATKYNWTFVATPVIRNLKTGVVEQRLEPKTKTVIQFSTVRPPFIASFAPQGDSVRPDSELLVHFAQPMNIQSAQDNFSISPALEASFSWDASGSAVKILHPPLQKGTAYIVSFGKGTQTAKGGTFTSEASFSFHTAGPLTVSAITPEHNTKGVSLNNPISIIFDQEIPGSLANVITVVPPITGKREIAGSAFHIIPDVPLPFDTKYTITVPAGTTGIYGLPTTTEQIFAFTTQPNETILPVPFFEQQASFTCNIAAARMLLAYQGINVSEATLIGIIGSGGKRGSGDPNKGYIDDYGTYWDAVSRGVTSYRPNRIITSGLLSDLINELVQGKPVMTWGQNGWSDPHEISWTTPDGKDIHAINGMHSTVVRGFRGPKENPTDIFLNDPWRGQYDIPVAEFMRRWGYLKIALVID